jgi:DNA-binding CsgD family transcriptional regulator
MLRGREREQDALEALLSEAEHGAGAGRLLVGEPGMGKSALLDYARDRAVGFRIATVTGIERESDLAYAGLYQLLRPWFGRISSLPPAQAQALSGALGLADPEAADRFLVSAALLELLAEAASDAPLLVTVDDAQWLDGPTVDAIVFAARRLAADRVAVIIALRDEGDSALQLGLPALRLGGLDREAIGGLLCDVAGHEVPHTVARVMEAHTCGNPLALAELCRLLTAEQLSGRAPLPDPLPVDVRLGATFVQRVTQLPASARTALLVAATAGGEGLDTVLGAGTRLGVTVEDLDAAERAGLVSVHRGSIAFRHPLMRAASYHAATFTERRAAHLALADVLGPSEDAERRAWHLAAAAAGPDARVAELLEQVGTGALARGANASAAAAFERAAELTEDREKRLRRRLAGVQSARAAGLYERALAALDASEPEVSDLRMGAEIVATRARIDAAHRNAYGRAIRGFLRAAQAMAAFDRQHAADLLIEAAVTAEAGGCWGELDEIVSCAQGLWPDDAPVVRFLRAYGRAVLGQDDSDGDTLASFGEPGALGVTEFVATQMRGLSYFDRRRDGTEPELRALLNAAVEEYRTTDPLRVPSTLVGLGFREFQAGSWQAARANLSEAVELAQDMRLRLDQRGAMNILALIAAAQGRFDELEELTGADSPPASGVYVVVRAWARGLGALGAGRPDEALALLDLGAYEEGRHEAVMSRWQIADLVEAAVKVGRPEIAERTLGRFEPLEVCGGSAIGRALHARARGLLAEGEQTEQLLRSALVLHDQALRPFERARTELVLGEHLRRERRRSDAREPLRAALREFERLGAAPWAQRARTELRATGETFRRRDPTALETLTPQEFQVARLAAAGGRNRDLAAQLFLSHSTVSYHLHNVYRKLGVASRTELARVDFERGLAVPIK